MSDIEIRVYLNTFIITGQIIVFKLVRLILGKDLLFS